MRKAVLWIGVAVFIIGVFLFFIAGSTSGPDLKPTIPLIYGTNQAIWGILAIAGVIVGIVGLILRKKQEIH